MQSKIDKWNIKNNYILLKLGTHMINIHNYIWPCACKMHTKLYIFGGVENTTKVCRNNSYCLCRSISYKRRNISEKATTTLPRAEGALVPVMLCIWFGLFL